MKTLLILAVSCLCLSAIARLGESNAEIFKRYGAVLNRIELNTNSWAGLYTFKEYNVKVIYLGNISVVECLSPIAKRKFEGIEAEALMSAITGKGKWIPNADNNFIKKNWTNSEAHAIASIDDALMGGTPSLIVADMIYGSKWVKINEDEQKKKAEGF